jgi:hypothetical protein
VTQAVTGKSLPGEEGAREAIERTFARELARLDATFALAVKLLEANDSIVIGPSGMGTIKSALVVLGLYGKAVKTVRGIRQLASAALVEDGLVLCRALLETTVAILYLLQRNTPRRADEYLAHILMRTKKIMGKWQDTPGLKRWAKEITKRTDSHLVPYDYLGPARLKQLRTWYSGDHTIEETFKRVGLNRLYQEFYLYLSSFQHVSDLPSHAEIGDKGQLVLTAGSSNAGQMRVLLDMTNRILWTAMGRVSQKIGLGYELEIERHRPPRDKTRSLIRAWSQRHRTRGARHYY